MPHRTPGILQVFHPLHLNFFLFPWSARGPEVPYQVQRLLEPVHAPSYSSISAPRRKIQLSLTPKLRGSPSPVTTRLSGSLEQAGEVSVAAGVEGTTHPSGTVISARPVACPPPGSCPPVSSRPWSPLTAQPTCLPPLFFFF